MKRTKEWWSKFSEDERRTIWWFEKNAGKSAGLGGGGYLPDDCGECAVCGNICYMSSPCISCINEYEDLINRR